MKHRVLFFVSIACMLAAGAAALCACEETPAQAHVHAFGAWSETAATCTEDGSRERVCSECGKVEKIVLPSTGHDFEELSREDAACEKAGFVLLRCKVCKAEEQEVLPALQHVWEEHILQEATCKAVGSMEKTCSRCGDVVQEEIPLAEHRWGQIHVVEEPTCTKTGVRSAVCETCGKREEEQTIPAKGHTFGEWRRTTDPTCVDAGEDRRTCNVCGDEEAKGVPALGHRFDTQFTVDKDPTYTQEGSKSRHCLNKGCSAREEVTPIPQLKDETEYAVTLLTTTGKPLSADGVSISLLNGDEEAAKAQGTSARFTLSTKSYTVQVSGLPEGYALAKEYEVTPAMPQIEIRVPAHMVMEKRMGVRYSVGSVMCDWETQTVEIDAADDRKVDLSTLFSGYKAVLINMFFTTCSACVSEMPAFVQAYNAKTAYGTTYGEEVCCILLDWEPYTPNEEPIDRIRNFRRQTNYYLKQYAGESNVPMTVLHDVWLRSYFTNISGGFYPTSILIDCEGVIVSRHVGGLSKQGFIDLMQEGIDRYNTIEAWRESEGLTFNTEESKAAPVSLRCDLAPAYTTADKRKQQ